MVFVARAMSRPDSGLEIRDRLWLKITIPRAFIGQFNTYILTPLTHVTETGAINRLGFSGAGFWYVCHAYMDSSGICVCAQQTDYSEQWTISPKRLKLLTSSLTCMFPEQPRHDPLKFLFEKGGLTRVM